MWRFGFHVVLAALTLCACTRKGSADTDLPPTPEPRLFGADQADVQLDPSHELLTAPGRVIWSYAVYWDGQAPMVDLHHRSADGQITKAWSCDLTPNCSTFGLWLVGDIDGTTWVAFEHGGTRLLPLDGTVRLASLQTLPVVDVPGPGLPCGDVSGDGVLDLCGAGAAWFGPLDLTAPADRTWDVLPDGPAPVAADPDGDGASALFVPTATGLARIDPDAGLGHLSDLPTWTASGPVRALASGDLDGDGLDELIVQVGTEAQVRVLGPSFEEQGVIPIDWPLLTAGDVTGDGQAELLVGDEARLQIVGSDGQVLHDWIGDATDDNNTPAELARGVHVVDVDLDGTDDLVIAGRYGWGPGYVVYGPITPDLAP